MTADETVERDDEHDTTNDDTSVHDQRSPR